MTVAVLAAASSAILTRFSSAPPLVIAFYRLALTVLILAVPLLWQYRQELAAISRRDLLLSAASGLFLGVHFGAWISSLFLTTVASSTVLVSTHPFLVLALGVFLLGERVSLWATAGAGLAVLGAVLVGWGDFDLGPVALAGDALAFLGAVAFAAYVLIGRSVRQRVGVLPYTVTAYSVAAISLLAAALASGQHLLGHPARDWLIFLALAVFPTILGHTVFNWALRYVKASVVSVGILGEPLGAAVLAWTIFGELPGSLSLAGGALILCGIGWFLVAAERGG